MEDRTPTTAIVEVPFTEQQLACFGKRDMPVLQIAALRVHLIEGIRLNLQGAVRPVVTIRPHVITITVFDLPDAQSPTSDELRGMVGGLIEDWFAVNFAAVNA